MARSLVEAALSNTVVEESDTVVYEVVEEGTIRKMKKLVSSDGFSYCVKVGIKLDIKLPYFSEVLIYK